jgi:hypothetical protein
VVDWSESLEDRPAIHGLAIPLIAGGLHKRAGRLIVIHRKARSQLGMTAIAPGVEALDVERFVQGSLAPPLSEGFSSATCFILTCQLYKAIVLRLLTPAPLCGSGREV